ncbi:MAG TPA: heme NO-binding domain-containing protein [Candidatus Dormibacteraeota bacterium]|nr:heme NO-binding domain-containing protein [Candidatus Dormibacteraeota bacterium]
MQGVILDEMRLFVAQRYGYRAWLDTLKRSERSATQHYELDEVYPDEELGLLAFNASEVTGTPPLELLEAFGEALAPDMMRVYSYLLDPAWGFSDFLLNMEPLLHEALKLHTPGAQPIKIRARRAAPDAVEVTYTSPLRACAAVRGVIAGAAREYGVGVAIVETECGLRGGPQCVFQVQWQPRGASGRS